MNKKITKEQYVLLAGISVFLFAIVFVIINRRKITGYVTGKIWDISSDSKINALHPKIRDKAREFIDRADKELGMKLRVAEGCRTFAEQDADYAKGRTTAGSIITYAKGGESYHNYCLALDVVEMKDGVAWGYDKTYPADRWAKIGALGKKIGFEWGGDWASPKTDKPHFQMTFGHSEADLLAMKNNGKETGGYVIV